MDTLINVINPHDAETLWVIRDRVKFMGEISGSNLSIVEIEVPPKSGTPPHRHASPEIFRILNGEITFGIFNKSNPKQVVADPGVVVTVPPNEPHNYINNSEHSAAMIVVLEKQMTDFFRDLGRTEMPTPGPPSTEELSEIIATCQRHGIEILNELED